MQQNMETDLLIPEPTQSWMFELSHESPETLRNEYIPRLNKVVEGGSAALGVTLAKIYASGEWRRWQYQDDNGRLFPYDSFDDFVRRELSRSLGTCMELRFNWEYFSRLGYEPAEFIRFASEIGWPKVREMRVHGMDRAGIALVQVFLGQGPCTKGALRKQIQELIGHGPVEGTGRKAETSWITLRVNFPPDQWEVVEAALTYVKRQAKTKDNGQALVRMATGYLASVGRKVQDT